ncbi:nitroreductase family protein [Xanthovirga aplysinae]|uniref:nitroreductase family protein n=1 Tax=Xanthovirga aplysinae TaxID=2529853 RepID=UPI0012BC7210|nr:nitroreductase [Xanthovirga aplysinae]MTI31935.1 nitroreductase [Xanthovirga aplysinae]
MSNKPEEINQLIRNRRSIYPNMYSGEKIDQEIIEKLLENANWAPTHGITEPWRFTVFTGEGLKKLATFQSELYKKGAEAKGNFQEEKFQKLATKPLKASHIISIGMSRDPKGKIPEIEEVEAVACAVQNMYLTATAYGVGCYWSTGGVTYMEEAKEYFGLKSEDKLLGFLFLGIPKNPWPKGKRKPIKDKIRWVK